jgi:hypothetical protein
MHGASDMMLKRRNRGARVGYVGYRSSRAECVHPPWGPVARLVLAVLDSTDTVGSGRDLLPKDPLGLRAALFHSKSLQSPPKKARIYLL